MMNDKRIVGDLEKDNSRLGLLHMSGGRLFQSLDVQREKRVLMWIDEVWKTVY